MPTNNIKTEWRVKSRGMWVAGVNFRVEEETSVDFVGLVANEENAKAFEDFDDVNNIAKTIGGDIFATTITTSTRPIRWPEKGATDAEHPDA